MARLRHVFPAAMLVAMASPAFAQPPRVPVPIAGGLDYPACSTATIMNLRPTDRFLSVRAAPSKRARVIGRLRNGEAVFACVRRGNWFGIVFERPGRHRDCDVDGARRAARAYSGPCRSGWVHYDYIGGYADWISP